MHKILVRTDNFSNLIVIKLFILGKNSQGFIFIYIGSMKEKSIAKFKYENSTYKLLEITMGMITTEGIVDQTMYIIVKNRRRQCTCKWLDTAKKKFMSIIAADLMQQKISF